MDTVAARTVEGDNRDNDCGSERIPKVNVYRQFKTRISEINWFDNSEKSMLMLRARLNTLNLNWKKKHTRGSTNCPLCDSELENLEHFLLFCAGYSEGRQKYPPVHQSYPENTTEL